MREKTKSILEQAFNSESSLEMLSDKKDTGTRNELALIIALQAAMAAGAGIIGGLMTGHSAAAVVAAALAGATVSSVVTAIILKDSINEIVANGKPVESIAENQTEKAGLRTR